MRITGPTSRSTESQTTRFCISCSATFSQSRSLIRKKVKPADIAGFFGVTNSIRGCSNRRFFA
ncbi:hypothetical protein D3C87_1832610 [compost metagenome]